MKSLKFVDDSVDFNTNMYIIKHRKMLVVEFQEFPCEIPYQQKHVLHPSRMVARHGARVEQHR